MAITFFQKRKIQRYLIPVFIGAFLITGIIIWQGFFKKEEPPLPEEVLRPFKKIKINFEILKSLLLEELQPFEEIPPFEEEIGRENPFLPY